MESFTQQNRMSTADQNETDSPKEFVAGHPMSRALTAFGAGVVGGLALAVVVARGAGRREDEGVAHRLGRQMIEVIGNAIPDSLSKLGH